MITKTLMNGWPTSAYQDCSFHFHCDRDVYPSLSLMLNNVKTPRLQPRPMSELWGRRRGHNQMEAKTETKSSRPRPHADRPISE